MAYGAQRGSLKYTEDSWEPSDENEETRLIGFNWSWGQATEKDRCTELKNPHIDVEIIIDHQEYGVCIIFRGK